MFQLRFPPEAGSDEVWEVVGTRIVIGQKILWSPPPPRLHLAMSLPRNGKGNCSFPCHALLFSDLLRPSALALSCTYRVLVLYKYRKCSKLFSWFSVWASYPSPFCFVQPQGLLGRRQRDGQLYLQTVGVRRDVHGHPHRSGVGGPGEQETRTPNHAA